MLMYGNDTARKIVRHAVVKYNCRNQPSTFNHQPICGDAHMSSVTLDSSDALIIVDVQNDFCPGGALPVRDCSRMIDVLNQWIDSAQNSGSQIVITRDWHPADHVSFREQGGPWPAHCVQGTWGAQFCDELRLPEKFEVVSKGADRNIDSYSDFEGSGLAEQLAQAGVRRVWVGGLALDVCVRATVLDALEAGFETHLIREGTQPIDEDAGRRALEEMQAAGAIVHGQ
jgi:nicotinamidase/pyrazinamidase